MDERKLGLNMKKANTINLKINSRVTWKKKNKIANRYPPNSVRLP